MSTKASLKYGDNFNFYEECFEQDGSVYLQLDEAEVELSTDYKTKKVNVVLKIPLDIWNKIVEIGTREKPKC